MFKIFSIGVLLYLLYKLVFPPKSIAPGADQHVMDKQDEVIDIDYEELD